MFTSMFLLRLGVRSLANASGARQFNPLNPLGVGWVPLPQTDMAAVVGRARSCVVVRGRAWSCVRGRSCVVVRGRAWSCVVVRGRAQSVVRSRSCAVGRARSCVVGRARSCAVVRGRAWSVGHSWSFVVVPALPSCPLRGQHCRDTNERRKEGTNEQHLITP